MTEKIEEQRLAASLALRIERLCGTQIFGARRVTMGYGATQRWLVDTVSGSRYFVKVGVTPPSIDALRHEASVYERFRLRCMPAVVAWEDNEKSPILVLEDLSGLEWPPAWSEETVGKALALIDTVHASSGPLLSYEERNGTEWDWWRAVEREPEGFLRLNITTPEWLRSSLPALIKYAASVSPTGSAVGHFDLRSDNFCFSRDEARLVDWSLACLGNAKLDLGLFLPCLAAEHGLSPESVLPNEPGIAAWVAGFFAWHAGKPVIPTAPGVRVLQQKLLRAALPWVTNELGLQDHGRPWA